jgi:hypothetical protein
LAISPAKPQNPTHQTTSHQPWPPTPSFVFFCSCPSSRSRSLPPRACWDSTCTTTQLITLSSANVISDLTAQFNAQLGVGYNWQNSFVYLPLPLSATLTYVIYDPNYDASKYAIIKSIQDDIMAKLCHGGLLGVKIDVSIGAVCALPSPPPSP